MRGLHSAIPKSAGVSGRRGHALEHDLLEGLLPRLVALAGDDIVQGLESGVLLPDGNQLIGTLERVLRLLELATVVARHG